MLVLRCLVHRHSMQRIEPLYTFLARLSVIKIAGTPCHSDGHSTARSNLSLVLNLSPTSNHLVPAKLSKQSWLGLCQTISAKAAELGPLGAERCFWG